MSKEYPKTWGESFCRSLLPADAAFDHPRWWRIPAKTIDAHRAALEQISKYEGLNLKVLQDIARRALK